MIKRVSTFILFLLFFSHTNYILTYFALFNINKNYLVSEKCEMIVTDCEAGCYMNKVVEEQTENKQESETVVISLLKITEFKINDNFYLNLFPKELSYITSDIKKPIQNFSEDFFQPPKV